MAYVEIETLREGIVQLRLNRPDRLNAIDFAGVVELHDALTRVGADRDCRVVILTGTGRGFCAGLDLKGAGQAPGTEGLGRVPAGMKSQELIADLIPHMRSIPQPIIAAVNGAATGGGLALALGSDVRIAARSARFGVAFVKLGLSGCDIGVSYLLPRLVGASKAFELMLTGRVIDAAEADSIGLLLKVVDDRTLLETCLETAELIRANSPFGVWMTKEVMWANLETPSLHAAIDRENRTQILSSLTGDMAEAVAAFAERRPPRFGNR